MEEGGREARRRRSKGEALDGKGRRWKRVKEKRKEGKELRGARGGLGGKREVERKKR